ncbi:MAG: acetyl-CoA carboxylase biotin carboxyl carrier protein subunit [Oligoflexia bacterium]|nr:acetyl-CoA carboxylase biotin carboxyl carrier protein subunit [Oligoflexia bacterium]MBF0367074.1 acetyl-CoA carboxylase biotin carboxyl carrier protein subunit [Oligoflexia bacterium]
MATSPSKTRSVPVKRKRSISSNYKTLIPGKVIQILVGVGNEVKEGQILLVFESMKMENEIKAHCDGTIKAIHVKEGETLDQGVLMLEFD